MTNAEPIFDIKPEHGEGPIWCSLTRKFYCVDLLQGEYYKIDWETGDAEKFNLGQELGVMALCENNQIIAAVRDGFGLYDEDDDQLRLIPHSPEINIKERRMNDGAIDPTGRFLAGTMEYDGANPTGKLYALDQDLKWDILEENIYITNGMGWSPDGMTYYMIDTFQNVMYAYDYDLESGKLFNKRNHIEWNKDEYPDGMTIDSEGGFWVAMWMGSKISHFDVNGQWIEDITVPVVHTTSCCFGGNDLKTLLITTSQLNLSEQEKINNPLAGRCFALQTNVVGQVEPRFKYYG